MDSNINSTQKLKHQLKLDFFINLKVTLEEIQKIISLVNIIFLIAVLHKKTEDVPDIYLTRIEPDSIVINFECSDIILEGVKSLIIDINKLKKPENIPEDHYFNDAFNILYSLIKQNMLKETEKYYLFINSELNSVDDIKEISFKWIKVINAINGKELEERRIFEDRFEVLDAYNQNRKEYLMDSELSGMMLDGIELIEANFRDAELVRTNLTKANLHKATFENANMNQSILIGANLTSTIIKNTTFSNANILEADFSESVMLDSDFTGVMLIGSNMRRCTLENSCLDSAILSRADIFNSGFRKCTGKNVNFVGVNGIDIDFSYSKFINSDFVAARFQGIKVVEADLTGSRFLEANLSNVKEYLNSNFTDCDWWNASELSSELLNFLRTVYPCTLSEQERIDDYKRRYNSEPSEEVMIRQDLFLGIIKEDDNIEENKEKDLIEKALAGDIASMSQEEMDELAEQMWKGTMS